MHLECRLFCSFKYFPQAILFVGNSVWFLIKMEVFANSSVDLQYCNEFHMAGLR